MENKIGRLRGRNKEKEEENKKAKGSWGFPDQ